MNEEAFNLEIRRFLKGFGVAAQREIEKAVEAALRAGTLKGREVLPIRATLTIPGLLPSVEIEGEIALAGQGPALA
jgi:Family of unknown function (DUF6494)